MKGLVNELLEYENTIEFLKKENEDIKRRITFLEELIPIVLKKENNIKNLELLSVSEVAEKLKVNKNYVYALIRKGYLIGLKLGSIKVTFDELQTFIDKFKDKDLSNLENIKNLNPYWFKKLWCMKCN